MIKQLKMLKKSFILFLIGGVIYYCIEIFARGYSFPSMFIVGGLSFLLVGALNEYLPWDWSITTQALAGGICITAMEFISGCILNLWLGLNIWDYSQEQYQILGQISLLHSCYWCGLSLIAIWLDDMVRWLLFHEEKPKYRL